MSYNGRSATIDESGVVAKVFWDKDEEKMRIELEVGGTYFWLDYESWVLLNEGIHDGWSYVNGPEAPA